MSQGLSRSANPDRGEDRLRRAMAPLLVRSREISTLAGLGARASRGLPRPAWARLHGRAHTRWLLERSPTMATAAGNPVPARVLQVDARSIPSSFLGMRRPACGKPACGKPAYGKKECARIEM